MVRPDNSPASARIDHESIRHLWLSRFAAPPGLRNAARIYVRAGAPMDRNVLVTTCPSPSAYIEGDTFNRATKTNAAISR
ncbi:MAG: hypothetical protein ACOYM8_13230 [Caulobacterales bacterium]|jgi:hypothetical protein